MIASYAVRGVRGTPEAANKPDPQRHVGELAAIPLANSMLSASVTDTPPVMYGRRPRTSTGRGRYIGEHEEWVAILRGGQSSVTPINPQSAALIVVDIQRYFRHPSFRWQRCARRLVVANEGPR